MRANINKKTLVKAGRKAVMAFWAIFRWYIIASQWLIVSKEEMFEGSN